MTFTEDLRRQLLTATDALGFTATNVFDENGRVISRTDRHGNTASITHTPWGRNESITGPSGATTTQVFNADGLATRIINALGQSAEVEFDPLARPAKATNPLGPSAIRDRSNTDKGVDFWSGVSFVGV